MLKKHNKYIIFTAMGFELVGLILAAVFLGSYLDQKFESKGLIIVLFSITSLASWIFHIVVLSKKIEKSDEKSDENSNDEK